MSQSATHIRGTKRNLDSTTIYQPYLAYTIQQPPYEQLVSMASRIDIVEKMYLIGFILSIDPILFPLCVMYLFRSRISL
jgi:hypothetical protein